MDLEVTHRTLRFRTPLRTSYGEVAERDLFSVSIDGVGFGEAAPLEAYDGVPARAVAEALAFYAELLREFTPDVPGHLLLDACRRAVELPEALAAVDIALWDRAGKLAGTPIASMLTSDPLDSVPVNATIGALDRAGAAGAAVAAAEAGYGCVKLKVGVGDDAGRVAAVRAALGPSVALRLDANGAWTVDEAVGWIDALAPRRA